MNYFQLLGIIFGVIAFMKPFYMHLLPWDENKFIEKAYVMKRPTWVFIVGIFGLMLVGFTWYKELTTDIQFSLVITILFSITSIKAIFFVFDYEIFQKWISSMLNIDNGKKIIVIDILVCIFGLLLIILSIILY